MSAYNLNESYDSYRTVDLEARAAAASPYELVLVLLDGLLDELARARGHIEAKRYQQKGQSLAKCLNITRSSTLPQHANLLATIIEQQPQHGFKTLGRHLALEPVKAQWVKQISFRRMIRNNSLQSRWSCQVSPRYETARIIDDKTLNQNIPQPVSIKGLGNMAIHACLKTTL